MKYTILRPAIAMIELIFAIVVIGITLLSAPLVLNQSIQSNTVAMQQESIAAAATQISLILTHSWDESASNTARSYDILNVTNGNNALNAAKRDLNTTYSTRRFSITPGFTNATPAANLGPDVVNDLQNNDDIDDFNGNVKRLTIYNSENENLTDNKGEYLDTQILMTDSVSYGNDTPSNGYGVNTVKFNNPFTTAAQSTNIKLVHVTLTSGSTASEHNKSIVLGAFSSNIGVPNVNPILLP